MSVAPPPGREDRRRRGARESKIRARNQALGRLGMLRAAEQGLKGRVMRFRFLTSVVSLPPALTREPVDDNCCMHVALLLPR